MAQKWFLVILQFSLDGEGITARLKRDLPIINDSLKRISNDVCNKIISATNAEIIVWALRTHYHAKKISNVIGNPGADKKLAPGETLPPDTTRARDRIIVFELGEDRSFWNLNVPGAWLDRHWNLPE